MAASPALEQSVAAPEAFLRSRRFLLLPCLAALVPPTVVYLLSDGVYDHGDGTLVYSVVGGLINDDFLWVLNENPYIGAEDIYGRGPLLHFVRGHKAVLGTVGLPLFIAGGAWTLWRLLKERRQHAFLLEEAWLIFGCFGAYLGMHSIFWHYGLFGSLGLLRVMAAVSPLGAIAIVRALDSLRDLTASYRARASGATPRRPRSHHPEEGLPGWDGRGRHGSPIAPLPARDQRASATVSHNPLCGGPRRREPVALAPYSISAPNRGGC